MENLYFQNLENLKIIKRMLFTDYGILHPNNLKYFLICQSNDTKVTPL